jgi:hypothetical protein
MCYPMAYEPRFKLQKQLHFDLFWDAIKNGYIRVLFIFIEIKIDIRAHSRLLGFQKKEDIRSFFTLIFTNNYTR